jgi:SAM-dependent methyltransferase
MEHIDLVGKFLEEPGVEIGAFKTPIPGIRPVYVDRFAEYAREATLSDYYGDACELPYFDSSLGYVATSHVLEHVANPLAAIAEWYRVLRHNGVIYAVIPDRRRTFDHTRQPTSLRHLLDDYRNGVTQSDATHIDDFALGVDWGMFSPNTKADLVESDRAALAAVYHRSVEAGLEINIHFHVFDSELVLGMLAMGNQEKIWPGRIDVIRVEQNFPSSNPNGFLIVARIHKPVVSRLRGLFAEKGLRKDARTFEKKGVSVV